ncbi:YDG domain-containing protein [Janthinobacterium sp. LB3P118]|uniref:YDG domain-containing protein n=1 Tax=Janthinobacterium sp. LB3P118 TaxID=3424195 RepID=UPI003F229E43
MRHASMNRIYRLIWSHVHHAWVIVPERTRGRGKAANRSLVFSALLAATPVAMAGPTGGQVTAGNGSISQNGSTTTVTQASQNLSLHWKSFNTTSQETVNFVQPSASAIAVNRISDTNGTQFFGRLNANGQVYLINPNGVLFGAGSHINVGGLVASTLDISDAGLNGTTRHFSGSGTGSIINQGTINAAHGGYVAFIGNTVSNQGSINAGAGAVALGAGSDVTLAFSGDSLVNLQVKQSTLNNLAENGGLIKADGGAVWLSAGARDALLASVINNTGIVQARSVHNVNGSIVLAAGSAGSATNSGTLDASGSGGASGGTVKVLGGTVKLAAGSAIDVSGEGGGTALVGGSFLGGGSEQRAHTTVVDAGASIKADAISRGNGGNVAVWSDNSTQFNGSITARGGVIAGNGGKVETSGKALNVNASASVSTAAPHGVAGEWLLDPDDILIGNASIWGNAYGINVDTRVLSTALNNGNVTIKTTGASASCTGTTCTAGGSGNGDIIILDGIGFGNDYSVVGYPSIPNWTSNTTLTLSAYRNVQFKLTHNVPFAGTFNDLGGGIEAQGGGNIVLRADNGARGMGTVIFDDPSAIHSNIFLVGGASAVSIYYNPSSYDTPTDYTLYINNPGQLTAYMAVNLSGTIAPKVYDGTMNAGLAGLNSLLTMPTGLTLNTAGQAATFADKNAGTDKAVTISGVTFSGGGTTIAHFGRHYYLNGLDSKTGTITAKSINVSGLSASDKTYDGTTSATLTGAGISSSDLIGGDIVSLVGGAATGTFADANAGSGKSVAISGYALTGMDAANYKVVQPASVTATIRKADLVLSGSKTYDGNTAVAGGSLTATGVAGQTFSVGGAGDASNLASKNVQTGTALGSAAGLVLGSSGNGGLSGNYNVLGTAGSSYTVTAKGITLTGISAVDKTYDATTTAGLNAANVAYSGMIAGDNVSLAGHGVGSFASKDAGANKTVSVSGFSLGGSDAGNYVVTQPTGLTATISKADLVVSGISAVNKTYDAGTGATLSGTAAVSGLLSDNVSVVGTGSGSFADANAGSGKSVAISGYALTGMDAGNYKLVQPASVTATIRKADLILSGSKTYDGNTAVAGGSLTATGVAGQTFSVGGAGDASNLASKNVQTGTALGSAAGLVLGSSGNGGLSGNYNVLGTAGSSYTVTAKGITLTGISAVDKTYDATTTAGLNAANVGYSGMIAGDNVSLAGHGVGSFASKDAGANKTVSVSGFSLGGADAGNYVVTQPTGLTATISKADLVVSGISAVNKTYDAGTGATLSGTAAVSGLLSDNVSVVGTGSGSFADANAGSGKSVAVTGYALTGLDAANYKVVQPASVTATIRKADLILSGSKTYDGNTAVAGGSLTATGVAGQTFSVGGAGDASNLASKNVQTGTALGSAAGLVLGSSGNGGLSSNYNVLGTAGSSYTVTAKGITLTGISAVDKTYDATTTAGLNTANVAYSGMIAGDNVSLAGHGVGSFASKDAGANKTVSVSGFSLGGSDAGNYVVTQPTGLTATISKADLVVSGISAVNKTYDAGTGATLSGSASVTALLSDNVSVVGTGSGSFADANAGSGKSVAVTGYALTGLDAANYKVVPPASVTATIRKADLVLSGSKTYDGNTAVAGGSLTATGVAGQTFSVGGAGDASNLASKNVQTGTALGSAAGLVLGSSGNGGLSGNYNVLGTAGSSYTVTAKGITLTGISAVDKTYDATTTAGLNTANVAYSGMIAGDNVSLGGQVVGQFASKDAGANKAVAVSGYILTGADAGNYAVKQPTGVTATIRKADLSLTGLTATDKVYDATTTAALSGSASLSGVMGRDIVSLGGTRTATFADKNVGKNKLVTVSGYALTGSDAGNYNIVDRNVLTASITPASITVSGITAADKVYDGSTAATVNAGNATLAGKFGSDVITISSTGLFSDAAAGASKTVNLSSVYGGADIGNYIIAEQTRAVASITAAPVVVPTTPGVSTTQMQQIQNTVTQVQSSVLPPQALAQPQALNLSSTLVVQQTDAGTSRAEPVQDTVGTRLLNTSTGFGTPAPTLQILNGGMQLPLVANSITE